MIFIWLLGFLICCFVYPIATLKIMKNNGVEFEGVDICDVMMVSIVAAVIWPFSLAFSFLVTSTYFLVKKFV